MKRKNGFTLIELLAAIGIISVLAAIVLVSMNGYRKEARSTKLLGSLNSAVAAMQSCWSFANGDVRSPSSGSNICYLGAAQQSNANQYSAWPNLSQIGSDYGYSNYWDTPPGNSCLFSNCKFALNNELENKISNRSYENGFFVKKAQAMVGTACFAKSSWFFVAKSDSDKVKVCCNSNMNGCKAIDYSTTCNSNTN
jgi:prepilin-type N-terminal cleavage/methylation domain-containing protein